MTVEEIYLKLKDELGAENEISTSPERVFIKNDEHTICTLGMNRSHEIIFVEFKPAPKDLVEIGKQSFVHPHPVEMLHDAGWRQAQITTWEEAEKLLEIINRSYKKKKKSSSDETEGMSREAKLAAFKRRHAERIAKASRPAAEKKGKKAAPAVPEKKAKPAPVAKAKTKAAPKAKPAKAKPPKVAARKAKPEKASKPKVKAKSAQKKEVKKAHKPAKKAKKAKKKK